MAITAIDTLQPNQNYVIFSDSLSTLQSLNHFNSPHPTVRKILHEIDNVRLRRCSSIKFCWIPSHIGIAQNEKADAAAKAAAAGPEQAVPVYHRDFQPTVRHAIKTNWERTWRASNQKLLAIKTDVKPFLNLPNLTRKEEVIISRLRVGHTRLTHGYLMDSENPQRPPPICPFCTDHTMTVRHLLTDCASLTDKRREYRVDADNLLEVLGDSCDTRSLLGYLRDIGIYDEI